jgi:hypothetical protein
MILAYDSGSWVGLSSMILLIVWLVINWQYGLKWLGERDCSKVWVLVDLIVIVYIYSSYNGYYTKCSFIMV